MVRNETTDEKIDEILYVVQGDTDGC